MKRNGWLKFFYIFYCVKSTVLCPGRAVQIVYLQHSLQLISARINGVAKALHVPISLWRYLVLATLAPGLISKQCVCHCVEASRFEGFGEPDSNPSWEDYEYWTPPSGFTQPPLCAGFTALVSLSQTLQTQAPAPHLHNIPWGCGSADTWKTMQLAREGGLRWNKEKIKVCSWHKNTVYVQWVSPIQKSIRAILYY